jgi:hypothetical protein
MTQQLQPRPSISPLFEAEYQTVKPAVTADRLFMGITGALFCFGLCFPIFFPASPKLMRTLSIVTALVAAGGFTATARPSEEKEQFQEKIRKARAAMLDNQMKSEVAFNLAQQKAQTQQRLLYWVMQQPPEQRVYWLQHYGLMGLVPPPPPPAQTVDVEATSVGGQTVAMPQHLSQQVGVQQAIAQQQQLDTSWFDKFRKRSGIICGESKDGKSYLLQYDLGCFIMENQDNPCEIFVGDPDYGSSHDDGEPNNWLGLEAGKQIYYKPGDIIKTVRHVNKIVNSRVDATADAMAKGKEAEIDKYPVLLIIDELPAVVSILQKDERDEFVEIICNILRRGLKQNVRFRLGTQTLAVQRTKLGQDILQQTEIVMLWRAAQVEENYRNLGMRDGLAKQAADAVAQLPRKLGESFVCVAYLEKKPQIRGIPTIKPIQLVNQPQQDPYETWDEQYQDKFGGQPEADLKAQQPADAPPEEPAKPVDPMVLMTEWLNGLTVFPSDEAIAQQWKGITGQDLTTEAIGVLRSLMAKASPRDKKGFSHFYTLYIKSGQWRAVRQQVLERDKCCQTCSTKDRLEVHHRPEAYHTLGNESLSDLITLCHGCHEAITKKIRSDRRRAA